ncbi:uncharacterized protein LOC128212382 [Mya arenaria]|uniref:uncharacterized protein LOC128212382 n=1 Tax=Mya arenaria TaxID=6604 RepID=UPI0022E6E190|nr:uncharacterized protein LOC128212382 [Mya arenaria]XP_052773778.1 uncharacterized protein LOC128212382 [Mya arenaria]
MEPDITERVFSGTLANLPELESTVVRVFLSSTFTDFQMERNWVMKHAVPILRKFCQERGLDFQIADMRWGVREDATDDHRTTELCLHEITNCQRVSRGPNFVTFLGDKYGFRPIPSEIEAAEFKLLKNMAMKLGHDTSLLLTWYKCDYNKEPTVYSLQPISSQFPHYFDMTPANATQRQNAQREWWSTVDKLTALLRQSATAVHKEGKLSEREKHKYFQSVTENEVFHGLLNVENLNNRVICFVRTLTDLNISDYIAGRFTDLVDKQLDREAEELREKVRLHHIPRVMPPDLLVRYNVPWDENVGVGTRNEDQVSYLHQFSVDFLATMEKLIDFDLRESLSARHRTPLFEEVVHHLHFARSKCETFCGREDLIQKVREKAQEIFQVESGDGVEETNDDHDGVMDDFEEEQKQVKMEQDGLAASLAGMGTKYVAGDKFSDLESDPAFNPKVVQLKIQPHAEFCRPVIVVGKSGSGKTALMAKLAEVSQSWYASKNPVFMVRFLGTSTMSTAIREVLFGLCEQIWQVYKIQRPSGIDFDADYQYLTKYFAALLWKIDVMEKPLTIVLDSVDQLNQTDHAHMLNWLPQKLPKNVTFLISLVTDRTDCFRNLQQVFPFSERFIEMNKFQNDVASDVIIMMNKKYSRHLSKKQKNMILDQFAYCSQPLYLKLLVDMSLSWRSYTDVNQSLLGATIKEAINHLFDNLEKNHGEILVQRGIGYLCAAREGLSEMELEDLLSLDDEVLQDTYIYHLPPDPEVIRLPPLLWKRIQYDIAEYVVERQSGGKKVIGWYHRQFSETARERYLHKGIRKMLHTSLAEYFQGIWSERCKPLQLIKGKKGNYPQNQRQVPAQPIKLSDHLYNTRKLSELSHHLVHSEQFETALNELFCDPDWLYAKCLTTTLTSLMEDLNIAQEACDQAIKRMKDEKEAFAKANGKEKEAKEVEDMIERNKKLLEGFRLVFRMILLAADSIRKDPVNLPLMVLSQLGPDYSGNPQVETLVQRCLTWCRSSPLPLMVPSRECVSKPGGIQLYSISIDVAQHDKDKRDPSRQCLYLREDLGQLYVVRQRSGGLSDQLCVFDLHDHGSCIAEETIGRYISGISFVGQNKYLLLDAYISSSGSQGVFSYDVKTEHLLFESSMAAPVKFTHPTQHIAVSRSGTFVACSNDKTAYIYQMEQTLQQKHSFNDHENLISVLLISPDETLLITAAACGSSWDRLADEVFVYDLKSKQKVFTVPGINFNYGSSLVTGSNILIGGKVGYEDEGTLLVYALSEGEKKHEIIANTTYEVDAMYLHSSNQYALTCLMGTSVTNGIETKHAALLDIANGKMVGKAPDDHNGPYNAAAIFGKEALYYATCVWDKNDIVIFFAGYVGKPLDNAIVVNVLTGHNGHITDIVIPETLETIITASWDNTVKVWDLKTILENFTSELKKLEMVAVQTSLQLNGGDMMVELEDYVTKYLPANDEVKPQTTTLALNRSGESVYVGTESGKVQVYDIESAKPSLAIDTNIGAVMKMMLSRDGRFMIVAGSQDIHVEDLHSQRQKTLEGRGEFSCMAEASNTLVVGCSGMEAKGRVWNIVTGETLRDFELLYSFQCVAINSSGTKVVSSMFEIPIVVDLENEGGGSMIEPEKTDIMMTGAVSCAISPDDTLAAMSSTDGAVRIIDMSGNYLFRLQQKSSAVALVFSKDGASMLSAGYRTIYVWSIVDGSCKYKLARHLDFVNDMKFDETGQFLVTISRDKQVILWDFARAVSIATFQANCQVKAVDIATGGRCVAFIPEGIADLAILQPNKSLQDLLEGKVKQLNLGPQVEAMALTFTNQRKEKTGKASKSCVVM